MKLFRLYRVVYAYAFDCPPPMPPLERSKYLAIEQGMSEARRASFVSAANICGTEGTCRRQAEALGLLSFGSVFFVDTKKMNSAGGPNPADVDFNFRT